MTPANGVGLRAPAAEVGPQQRGGDVDEAHGVGLGEVADLGERAELPGPEDLAAEHVADAHRRPAGRAAPRRRWRPGRRRRAAARRSARGRRRRGRGRGRVRRSPGWRRGVGTAVRLDDGRVEAHGAPAVDLDQRPQVVVRALPALARRGTGATIPLIRMWVCRMTPSSHSISRCLPWLSTDSIVRPARGVIPIEPRCLEADHLLVDERRPERRGRPVDRVALRHCRPTVGPLPLPVADASVAAAPWPDPSTVCTCGRLPAACAKSSRIRP